MRGDALSFVLARLHEAAVAQSAQPLHGGELATSAGTLLDSDDLVVRHVLGCLFCLRTAAAPSGGGAEDARLAAELLAPVGTLTPDILISPVPDPVAVRSVAELRPEVQRVLTDAVLGHGPLDPGVTCAVLRAMHRGTGDQSWLEDIVEVLRRAAGSELPGTLEAAAWESDRGIALWQLSRYNGNVHTLREAADVCRQAATAVPEGHQLRGPALSNLCMTLRELYERTSDKDALLEAVDAGRKAREAKAHPDTLSNLAITLRALYEADDDVDVLREAVDVGRQAVASVLDDDPGKGRLLSNLELALLELGGATGSMELIVEGAQAGADAVRLTSQRHPEYPGYVSNYSVALRSLYIASQNAEVLAEAVRAGRAAVLAASGQDPNRPRFCAILSELLQMSYRLTGDAVEAVEAVEAARAAVADTPPGHSERASRTRVLLAAEELQTEAGTSGGPPDGSAEQLSTRIGKLIRLHDGTADRRYLAEAVRVAHAAVAAAGTDSPDMPAHLANLAEATSLAGEADGDVEMLGEAVDWARRAVTAAGDTAEAAAQARLVLARTLLRRFTRTNDAASLDEATATAREATGYAPRLSEAWSVLTVMLLRTYERTDAPAVLADAVDAGRKTTFQPGNADHTAHETNLTIGLRMLGVATGDADLLGEAVARTRRLLETVPVDDPMYPNVVSAYTNNLLELAKHTGDHEQRMRAIDQLRAMLATLAKTHPDYPLHAFNLAETLRVAFEETKDMRLLEEAIGLVRTIAAALPPGHYGRVRALAAAGVLRRMEYERTGDLRRLTESVALGREALAACPENDRQRGRITADLANGLRLLGERTQDAAVLAEAVENGKLAATAGSNRSLRLANLSGMLVSLYQVTRDLAPLREAVEVGREAAAEPAGAIDRARALSNLSGALQLLSEQTDDDLDLLEEALESNRAAVAFVPAGYYEAPMYRSNLGRILNTVGRRTGDAAVLAEAASLFEETARDTAVPVHWRIEAARGWGHATTSAAEAVAAYAYGIRLIPMLAPATLQRGDREYRLSAIFGLGADAAAAAIETDDPERALELLERARGVLFADTVEAVDPTQVGVHADGPVVVLNVARRRCDAIILAPGQDPFVVALPRLTFDDLIERAQTVVLFRHSDDLALDGLDPEVPNLLMLDTLRWLWDVVAEPVLDRLDLSHETDLPRVWWCPTGLLALFPLHAAGTDQPGATVLDRVVSSYCFTVRSLHYACRFASAAVRTTPPLVVGMPETAGAAPLPAADLETREVRAIMPDTTVLRGEQADRDATLAALPRHQVVHLACHSVVDNETPADSGLVLHDRDKRPLTVADISRLHLADAELAFLSACSTMEAGIPLLDESVHITSAFVLAGYRQVIGTLWPIIDFGAVQLTGAFYSALPRDLRRAPYALHHAVCQMRASFFDQPRLWAAHIHVGR
ncbi:CHAT domain-containing protein [Streptomyces sp. GbtcB7]|uniref:CHAT domain-containing protein n=1 Tax=Streptomyces sp. GbtcB7 TaxID=2824752 RepID=UPI001C30DEE4|nr:CHAT domain-containing protein [Streptomyces sp. GbtcB7]